MPGQQERVARQERRIPHGTPQQVERPRMTLNTIRRTLRRAFERLGGETAGPRPRPVAPRSRETGAVPAAEQTAGLRQAGFAEEALPWMNAVYRFALRLTRDDDTAQDLVQETYLRAYRAWNSYQRGTSCRSWLFTICRNTFLHGRERSRTRHEVRAADIDATADALEMRDLFGRISSETTDADALFANVLDEKVIAAIDGLPEEYREVLVLSDLGDLTYPEIEQVLAIPRGTVKSRLFRARRLLQVALLEYGREMGYLPENAE